MTEVLKKYISLISAVLCVLFVSSCSSGNPDTTETYEEITVTETETETESQTEEITVTEEETEEEQTTDIEVTTEKPSEVTSEPETEKEPETEAPVTETEPETNRENELGFKADLSLYEKYLDPVDKDEYHFLVNPDHPLDSNYKPSDLILIADAREGRKDQLREYAAKALEAFLIESRANGCKKMTSVSAYRP